MSEHFAWADDYQEILGRTAIGRAAVKVLGLNREIYQRQRRLLRAAMRGGLGPWP